MSCVILKGALLTGSTERKRALIDSYVRLMNPLQIQAKYICFDFIKVAWESTSRWKQTRALQHFWNSNKHVTDDSRHLTLWTVEVVPEGTVCHADESDRLNNSCSFRTLFSLPHSPLTWSRGLKIPITGLNDFRKDVARYDQWNHLFFFSFLSLSAAVPRNSQLPPSVEHASVMAVWDWSVQSHLPLHLCPEELLHR